MEAKLGLGGMWSVPGQALRAHGHTLWLRAGRQVRTLAPPPLLQRKLGERSSAARVSHSRWPAAGRGSQATPIPAGLPVSTFVLALRTAAWMLQQLFYKHHQQNVTKLWDFLGFLSMRTHERLGFLSGS